LHARTLGKSVALGDAISLPSITRIHFFPTMLERRFAKFPLGFQFIAMVLGKISKKDQKVD